MGLLDVCHMRVIVILLFVVAVVGYAADDLSQTQSAAAGQSASHEYSDRLLAGVADIDDVDEITRILKDDLSNIPDATNRRRIYRYLAELHEIAFRLFEAQHYYYNAYLTSVTTSQIDYDSLYCSATLLHELGDYPKGRAQAMILLERTPQLDIRQRALLLLARIEHAEGNLNIAIRHLEQLIERSDRLRDAALRYLYDIFRNSDRGEDAQIVRQQLDSSYPDSLNRSVALSESTASPRILAMPTPAHILCCTAHGVTFGNDDSPQRNAANTTVPQHSDTEANTPSISVNRATPTDTSLSTNDRHIIGIQTGSFRVARNSQYMQQDLRELGFNAEIRTVTQSAGNFYQVIVPIEERGSSDDIGRRVRHMMIRLKEHGMEGFLLFED